MRPSYVFAFQRELIACRSAFSASGSNWSYWDPIGDLNRTDADVTIFFLSFNDIQFVAKNDDPVFSAHIPSFSSLGVPVWLPDQNISALACAEQHQYCNPNIVEGDPDRCTELTASELLWGENNVEDFQLLQDTGLTRLHNTSIHLNSFQEIIAGYSSAVMSAGMYFAVFSRGPSALKGKQLSKSQKSLKFKALTELNPFSTASETVYQFLQSPLPDNQWIVELSSWFQVGLATIQQSALEYATGPRDLGQSGVLVRPVADDHLGQRLCKAQSIRNSGQVQSFSILGMTLIFALGGLIILISFTMESAVDAIQRRWHKGEYRRRMWTLDEKLGLLATGQTEAAGDENEDERTTHDERLHPHAAAGSLARSEDVTTVSESEQGGDRPNAGLLQYSFDFERRRDQREMGMKAEFNDVDPSEHRSPFFF